MEEHGAEHKGGKDMRMNRTKIMWCASALMVFAHTAMTPSVQAQVLTGDTRLSCEAMNAATAFHPLALSHFLKLCPKK
jgi:hypothetical protein